MSDDPDKTPAQGFPVVQGFPAPQPPPDDLWPGTQPSKGQFLHDRAEPPRMAARSGAFENPFDDGFSVAPAVIGEESALPSPIPQPQPRRPKPQPEPRKRSLLGKLLRRDG